MSAARGATRWWAAVLWPSFLLAGAMDMLVFSAIDPSDLRAASGAAIELSRQGAYTLGFLAFWVLIGTACALTALLMTEYDTPAEERAGA